MRRSNQKTGRLPIVHITLEEGMVSRFDANPFRSFGFSLRHALTHDKVLLNISKQEIIYQETAVETVDDDCRMDRSSLLIVQSPALAALIQSGYRLIGPGSWAREYQDADEDGSVRYVAAVV